MSDPIIGWDAFCNNQPLQPIAVHLLVFYSLLRLVKGSGSDHTIFIEKRGIVLLNTKDLKKNADWVENIYIYEPLSLVDSEKDSSDNEGEEEALRLWESDAELEADTDFDSDEYLQSYESDCVYVNTTNEFIVIILMVLMKKKTKQH